MKRNFWLFCSAFTLVSFFTFFTLLVLSMLANPGYLELYDFRDTERSGVPYKVGYLRWHGRKTKLEIWVMKDMRSACMHKYITVENEDTFTVSINGYQGWAEFYINKDIIAVLYRSGELDYC